MRSKSEFMFNRMIMKTHDRTQKGKSKVEINATENKPKRKLTMSNVSIKKLKLANKQKN